VKPKDETDAHYVPDTKGDINDRDSLLPVLRREFVEGDQVGDFHIASLIHFSTHKLQVVLCGCS
jgi:hypothetical protein